MSNDGISSLSSHETSMTDAIVNNQFETPSFENEIVQATLSAIHQMSDNSNVNSYVPFPLTEEEEREYMEFLNEKQLHTPTINESSKQLERNMKVEDRLLIVGKEYQEKLGDKRNDIYTNTFSPHINEQSKRIEREESIEERLKKLDEARLQKLEKMRLTQSDENYSHVPTISKMSQSLNRKDVQYHNASFVVNKQQKIEKIREEIERKQAGEETFSPVLNPRTLKLVNRIKARMKPDTTIGTISLQREMERNRKAMEQTTSDLTDTSSPKITAMAAKLVRDGSVTDRLYELSFKMSDMKEEKMQQLASASQNLYDYSPRTKQPIPLYVEEQENNNHSNISKSGIRTRTINNILNRSEMVRLRKNAKLEEMLERQKNMHHPKINPVSEEIAARLPETTMQRLLSSSRPPRPQLGVEYTFKPVINHPSEDTEPNKRGISESDIQSRIEAMYQKEERRKEKLQKKRQALEEKELEGCTFSPITHRNQDPVFTKTFNQRVAQWDRRRRAKVARERAAVVQKEMKECTFSPKVKKTDRSHLHSPSTKPNSEPLGFEDFVQRQALAREKKELLSKGPWPTGENWKNEITVPKEFSFGQRPDLKVKALRRPISPTEVKTRRNLSPSFKKAISFEEEHFETLSNESDRSFEDSASDTEYESDAPYYGVTYSKLDEDDDYVPDVPPQGLFSSKSSVSILERLQDNNKFFIESGYVEQHQQTLNSIIERNRQNLEGGLLIQDNSYECSSPTEEWQRRAQMKDLMIPSPSNTKKKWREEHIITA